MISRARAFISTVVFVSICLLFIVACWSMDQPSKIYDVASIEFRQKHPDYEGCDDVLKIEPSSGDYQTKFKGE